MASQNRPASKKDAPDPSNSYERAHPENEAGQGRLDTDPNAAPADCGDCMPNAVTHKQDGGRQLNAGDAVNRRGGSTPENTAEKPKQPDHSMHDEEPTDSDLAPQNIKDARQKRHPRTGGKGGTPDAGESRKSG